MDNQNIGINKPSLIDQRLEKAFKMLDHDIDDPDTTPLSIQPAIQCKEPNAIGPSETTLDHKYIFVQRGQKEYKELNDEFNSKGIPRIWNGEESLLAGWYIDHQYKPFIEQINCYDELQITEVTFKENYEQLELKTLTDRINTKNDAISYLSDSTSLARPNQESPKDLKEYHKLTEQRDKLIKIKDKKFKQLTNNSMSAQINGCRDFSYLLMKNSEDLLIEGLKKKTDGIKTGYYLNDPDESRSEPIELILPGGALSVFAAPTSHCKTMMLDNIILNYADQSPDNHAWFLTCEESGYSIEILSLNTYINKQLCRNNRSAIEAYFRGDGLKYIKTEQHQDFLTGKEKFYALCKEGRINIKYNDLSSEELVEAIKYIKSQDPKLGLVVIDYMQLLKSNTHNKRSRQEELKYICIQLMECAITTGLPIVLAAQFNREVVTEADMCYTKIGEAGDISRAANVIIGMFNRTFDTMGGKQNVDKAGNLITKQNNIYIEGLKYRGNRHGCNAVLSFDGNTGKITTNKNTAPIVTNNSIGQKIYSNNKTAGKDSCDDLVKQFKDL